MRLRFRVWMPLVAVLLVLLSIFTLLLYVLPAARSRLGEYAEDRALVRAVAAANTASETSGEDLQRALDLAAETGVGEVLIVDREGRVTARAGERLISPFRRRSCEAPPTGSGRTRWSGIRGSPWCR